MQRKSEQEGESEEMMAKQRIIGRKKRKRQKHGMRARRIKKTGESSFK